MQIDEAVLEPESPSTSGVSRRTVMAGAAWVAPAVLMMAPVPAFAAVSPLCTYFWDGTGRGRILTGGVLGLSLDQDQAAQLVTLNGVTATNDGSLSAPDPVDVPGVRDEQNNNLEVGVLGLLALPLGGVGDLLSNVLDLPVSNDAGVYKQYAYAAQSGLERGAAGYVSDDGSIRTDGSGPGGAMPEFGTVDLRKIIDSPLLSALPPVQALVSATTGVDALALSIGALAGRAVRLQDCEALTPALLTREYLVGHLRLDLTPAENTLISTLFTTLTNITLDVNLTSILDVLYGIPVLGPVIQGIADINGSVTVSTASLGNTIPAPTGGPQPLQISLANNEITIDLAEAAGVGYASGGTHLNTVIPNTVLFVNTGVQGVTQAVSSTLDGLTTWLFDQLDGLVNINLTIRAGLGLLGAMVDVITITGTLGNLTVTVLPILSALLLGQTAAVTLAINDAVSALVEGALRDAIDDALEPVHDLLEGVFSLLYEVIHVRLNAQNDPADNNAPNTGGHAEPSHWAAGGAGEIVAGRYDVAALHLSAVGFLDVLNLFLARGAVGITTQRP